MKRATSTVRGGAFLRLVACWLLLATGAAPAFAAPDHSTWTALLARHVRAGQVDYAGLRRERTALDAYVRELGSVDAATLSRLSREERLAYWINAYNAFVVQTVVEHYPIRGRTLRGLTKPANSIWQIPDAFSGRRFTAGGERLSLDEIEHTVIRPTFREPRVHFALVCAARGCPPLRSEAYVPQRFDAQLDEQVRRYLTDSQHGLAVAADGSSVRLSRIFDWFAADFGPDSAAGGNAGVRAFLATHVADPALAARLRTGRMRIEYLDYDWTLNEQPGR